ncbi:MAG: DnaD domain protein [Oscillospiraceae bacterium]
MNYTVNIKQWGRFFSVPCSVVDNYILLSDGDFVKALLCILCSDTQNISTEQLAEKAGISPEKADEAVIHWASLGVISAEKENGKIIEKNNAVDVTAENNVKPIQEKKVDAKTRVKYTTREISEKIDGNDELKALFNDIQSVFKRTINATEMASILNLYEYYNFSAASILMIAEYCESIGKGRMAYIETVAKNWFAEGICSYKDVEEQIIRQTKEREFASKVIKAFGIEGRLSKRQKEYISSWERMGFSIDMIKIAYDKCIDSTNKLNFGYINKILENWSKDNIFTQQQVELADKKFNKNKSESKENKNTSYDLDEWENFALNFNPNSAGGDKQ